MTLHVPVIIRYPGHFPAGKRVAGFNQHKDLVPTFMELAGIETGIDFDSRSILPLIDGTVASYESEFYIAAESRGHMQACLQACGAC